MRKEGGNISKNIGKIFEDNWSKSVPKDILYYRPPDAAQGFDIGTSNKLRFSQKSPCDFMMFDGNILYMLEMKSIATNSISFEKCKEDKGVIHKYQLDSLSKFSVSAKYQGVPNTFAPTPITDVRVVSILL